MLMRRFYYILILALITSCTVDNKLYTGDNYEDTPIAFSTNITPLTTKAYVTTSDSLKQKDEEFNTSAYYVVNENDTINYFDATVTYDGALWVSNNPQFWPNSGSILFDAYSPLSVNNGSITNVISSSKSNHQLKYNCPSGIDDQIDLLVKRVEVGNKNTANIDFEHALSKIGFTIEFEDENNIILDSINIFYRNFECEKSYSFNSGAWIEPSSPVLYDGENVSTAINVDKQVIDATDNVTFNVDTCVIMIIPQSINESSGKYISVSIDYHIAYASGEPSTRLVTGTMPLPSPNTSNQYIKGEGYTYNLIVNGETIKYGGLNIVEPEDPSPAYGNIDLSLITETTAYYEVDNAPVPSSADEYEMYYYTTALRVESLMELGVRDFVVVGSLGADEVSTLGNGKLGYYGSGSSPFSLGPNAGAFDQSDENLFSVDLRGVSDFPMFKYMHADDVTIGSNEIIDGDSRIVPSGLFMDVLGLREVILPHGLSAVGDHSFANCDALVSIDISDVVHIETGSFQKCDKLTTVIGDNLVRVHPNGFDACASLVNIELGLVTEIDEFGFVNCSSLNNVDLSNLTSIGRHAFDGCTNLTLKTGTTIPAFEEVEEYAFSGCTQLGVNGTLINLENAYAIHDYAFNDCYNITLSSIYLNKLDTIGLSAFQYCRSIGEIQLPTIDTIGSAAFLGCSNLKITDTGIESIDVLNSYLFQGCSSLDNYFTFNNVTEVGKYAFSYCSNLRGLTMENLETIGGNFFSDCPSLEILSIPKVVENSHSWYDDVYDDSGTIVSHTLKDCTIFGMLMFAQSTLTTLNIGSVTASVPDWYPNLSEFPNLKDAVLSSVASVGSNGFYKCSSLESVDITSATSIGIQAFYNCTSLQNIISENITTIAQVAFRGCEKLESINFEKAETISDSTFALCTNLKSISLPSLKAIEHQALYGCTSLTTVDIPNATSIGNETFSNCSSLTSINMPYVTSIGNNAFDNCSSLSELILNDVSSIGLDFLSGCNNLKTIELASVGSIFWDGNWNYAVSVIANSKSTMERLVLTSAEGVLYGWDFQAYPNLKYVDLSSITQCGAGSFADNANLEVLYLKSLTTITGLWALSGCPSLTELDLSSLGLTNYYADGDNTIETTNISDLQLFTWGWDGSGCTLTLSAAQYDANVDGNSWAGITWGTIIRAE